MTSLNFIIIKINGIDVSHLPHDEAVQLFLRAQEPILVEVRRRNSDDENKLTFFNEDPIPPAIEVAVVAPPVGEQQLQEENSSKDACQTDLHHTSGGGSGGGGISRDLVVSGSTNIIGFDVAASPKHSCYNQPSSNQTVAPSGTGPYAECLGPEIDIEEITLRKSRSDEKLGFTVSYSSGNGSGSDSNSDDCDVEDDDNDDEDDDEDTCADIYISDILPDSLAARDGRLRQGDQILQSFQDDEFLDSAVYCDDKECQNPGNQSSSCECEQNTFSSKSSISNSEQLPVCAPAVAPSTPAVVVAPPQPTKLQSIVSIDTTDVCTHLNHANIKAQLESVNKEISLLNTQISSMKLQKPIVTVAMTTRAANTVITTTTITPTNSAISHRTHAKDGAKSSPAVTLKARSRDKDRDPPRIPFIPAPPPIEPDFEHIYETIPEDSETDSYYCSPYESKEQNRVEQWLKSQGDSVTLKNANMSHVIWNSVCKNNSSGDDYENSSSAYNTGGSCNSNPLTFELKADDKNQSSSTLVFRPYSRELETLENCKHCHIRKRMIGKDKLSPKLKKVQMSSVSKSDIQSSSLTIATSTSKIQDSQTLTKKSTCAIGSTTTTTSGALYTNVENLHQTIKLQQKLFRKALVRQSATSFLQHGQQRRSSSGAVTVISAAAAASQSSTIASQSNVANQNFIAPSLSQYQFVGGQEEKGPEQMVWKVKLRPDGTRYIVRRPVKSQLLQNRARRINEERNSQTTEDETTSEVKVGRYWTKDERKRHVGKSKERRQRQEMLIAAKKHETQQWVV